MFRMARPSLTMQLTSGMDVFAHVCGQKADISSNYCDKLFNHMTRDVSVFVINVTRFIDFFWIYHNFTNSNFCKVVRQHTEGMMGSIIWVLLEIYLAFQQWKNLENPLRIDKVIAMSMVYYFFWDTVYIACTYLPASQRPVTTGSRLLFCTCTTDVGLSVCTWVRPSKCKSGSRDPAHAPLQGNLSFISSPAISPRSKTSLGQNPDISLPDISPLNISRQDISLPGHKPPGHKPPGHKPLDICLPGHQPPGRYYYYY